MLVYVLEFGGVLIGLSIWLVPIEVIRLIAVSSMTEGDNGLSGEAFNKYKSARIHSSLVILATIGICQLVGRTQRLDASGALAVVVIFIAGLAVGAWQGTIASRIRRKAAD